MATRAIAIGSPASTSTLPDADRSSTPKRASPAGFRRSIGTREIEIVGSRTIAVLSPVPHKNLHRGSAAVRLWLRCSAAFNKLPEMARTVRRLNEEKAGQ